MALYCYLKRKTPQFISEKSSALKKTPSKKKDEKSFQTITPNATYKVNHKDIKAPKESDLDENFINAPVENKNTYFTKVGSNNSIPQKPSTAFPKIIPIAFLIGGLSLIGSALFPLFVWKIKDLPQAPEDNIVKPIPESVIAKGVSEDEESKETLDYTKASSWFTDTKTEWKKATKVKYYNLTIPKLNIKDATVEVGGEDLFKNLIHYKGTAVPGQLGNAVIFGHSSLPIFFNPRNYRTIFATLPQLRKEDKVIVNYDGVTYTYKVFDLKTVPPTDVSVLEQSYNDSYLTLITCVPPGTYLKRLVVKAHLISNQR